MKLLFWWMLCLLVYISIPSHSRQVVKIVYRRRKNHNPTPMPTARPTAIIYDAPDRSNNSHLFSWNYIFQTNTSKELPYSFASGNNDILSVRQLEFDYMNWHSRRYGSDWSFVKHYSESQIHPKSVGEFPSNCWMTPQAIAALCDWALLLPCLYGNINKLPRTIFVHHLMLPHFVDFVLPQIPPKHKFVLVTSGTDQTIPTSSGDIRFGPLRGFAQTKDGGPNWVTLTTHPQILHWFCENHDLSHPKVSTLPVGVIENVYGMTHINISEPLLPVDERPLKFLVAHRMRTGRGPWELRAHIMELCQNQQEEHMPEYRICVSPTWDEVHNDHRKGIPQHQYVAMAQQVPFVLCVRGGGLDPSPKAWEALMLGSIPILQHSTLDDAYGQLPVVFVDEWDDLFGNVEKVSERLEELRDLLAPYYNDKALRALVLQRLRMSYWMDIVNATVATGVLPMTTALALDF